MAAITTWYPSPCTDSNCGETHRINEDNERFHSGAYVRIAKIGPLAIFWTKVPDHCEVLPTPKLRATHKYNKALNIQLLKVQENLKASYYCYATGKFPHVAEALGNDENINNLELEQITMSEILKDAEGLEEISKGL
ncbi:MAG: hypothetical protein COT85_00150 [Chlamydiae bacterium CG10_big_fil_rev_8_21_14_0_10_42_34]|nr:MAG: hypothetical protein COT85_00150 [Chlamydiae bacterium CG10_big_fil_rev_8_21_14_0_10_42_34]